jgi:hypothetical protein
MTDTDIWAKIAAPLNPEAISWRQDGKVTKQGDRNVARWVCYIEAGTVRGRLDACVPGQWDLTLELLPPHTMADRDGVDISAPCAFKARLQILGVIREDVGVGHDYKQASTDAFKRAAVRFGIGHELYQMEPIWVEMDGDGKYAKPVEDPAKAYARKVQRNGDAPRGSASGARSENRSTATHQEAGTDTTRSAGSTAAAGQQAPAPAPSPSDDPPCPKCEGRMWDNRTSKRNPRAPDFKCRDRSCDGAIWPPKGNGAAKQSNEKEPVSYDGVGMDDWGNEGVPF